MGIGYYQNNHVVCAIFLGEIRVLIRGWCCQGHGHCTKVKQFDANMWSPCFILWIFLTCETIVAYDDQFVLLTFNTLYYNLHG
jgi:hypothetical protein